MANLTVPRTMKQPAKPCNPVRPETARYIYLGRVISGKWDKPEMHRSGPIRVISGRLYA